MSGVGVQQADTISLFLCGDVMTGRGIDQILSHPSNPAIDEVCVKSAEDYVRLAESVSGPIPRAVAPDYIWGDALPELECRSPDVRLINLETSVTRSDELWPGKGINYRMHPDNEACLQAAGVDCCALANNHVLDWGYAGLLETIDSLQACGLKPAGAGTSQGEAEQPAIVTVPGRGRVLIFARALLNSGVPEEWAATVSRAGVAVWNTYAESYLHKLEHQIASIREWGDIVVLSIHWGGNWGYGIPPVQRRFAHQMIDLAGVDVVYGHSSHHFKGIEVYRGKLILYGCGDFLNDYEGIGGHEEYRGDLALMYFATVYIGSGELQGLELLPLQIRQFRLNSVHSYDDYWVQDRLNREGKTLGSRVTRGAYPSLHLSW